MVLNPILAPEEIEREKGVIIEEIAMYEDTPLLKVGDVFEQLIFKGNPLGWDITGTPESVKKIKRNDFLSYRKLHYHSEDIILSISGGINEKEVLKLVKAYFGNLASFKGRSFKGSEEFKYKAKKPQVKIKFKKNEQAHLILGFLGNPRGYRSRFAEAVLSVILGGGMSSRLFIEVRERRGLAYSVKNSIDRYSDTGYIATYAGVDLKKVEEAIKVILDQHYGLSEKRYPVLPRELKKAKEYLKGHLALALEDTKDVNGFFAEQALFLEKILTPEEIFKKIDNVSIEEVVSEAKKLFLQEKLNLAIIGPYKDANRFERLLKA